MTQDRRTLTSWVMKRVPEDDPRYIACNNAIREVLDEYGFELAPTEPGDKYRIMITEPDGPKQTIDLGPIGLGVPSPGGA